MISQVLHVRRDFRLLIVLSHLRCGVIQFELCAHFNSKSPRLTLFAKERIMPGVPSPAQYSRPASEGGSSRLCRERLRLNRRSPHENIAGRSDAGTLRHFFAPQNVWARTRNERKQAKQKITSMKTKSNSLFAFLNPARRVWFRAFGSAGVLWAIAALNKSGAETPVVENCGAPNQERGQPRAA